MGLDGLGGEEDLWLSIWVFAFEVTNETFLLTSVFFTASFCFVGSANACGQKNGA